MAKLSSAGASCLVGWVSPFYVGQFDAHVAEQLDDAIRSLVGEVGCPGADRPYRRARSSEEALTIMRPDVPERLDREAFSTLERLLAEEGGTPREPGERSDSRRAEAVLHLKTR